MLDIILLFVAIIYFMFSSWLTFKFLNYDIFNVSLDSILISILFGWVLVILALCIFIISIGFKSFIVYKSSKAGKLPKIIEKLF